MQYTVGSKHRFVTQDTSLAEFNNCEVSVVRPLRRSEYDQADIEQPMYVVKTTNDVRFTVFQDELRECV